MKLEQTLVGAGVLVLGLLIAAGATQISSEAGYGGVGPNFLPWVVGGLLALCGAFLVWEALTGGFRELEAASGADTRPLARLRLGLGRAAGQCRADHHASASSSAARCASCWRCGASARPKGGST